MYFEGSVTNTGIRKWLSYATNFRTYSQKYKMYEIKLRTKISAITVIKNKTKQKLIEEMQKHFNLSTSTILRQLHDEKRLWHNKWPLHAQICIQEWYCTQLAYNNEDLNAVRLLDLKGQSIDNLNCLAKFISFNHG